MEEKKKHEKKAEFYEKKIKGRLILCNSLRQAKCGLILRL